MFHLFLVICLALTFSLIYAFHKYSARIVADQLKHDVEVESENLDALTRAGASKVESDVKADVVKVETEVKTKL